MSVIKLILEGTRSECRLRDHRLAVRSKNPKAEMKGRQKTSVQNVHQYQIYTKADYTPR